MSDIEIQVKPNIYVIGGGVKEPFSKLYKKNEES